MIAAAQHPPNSGWLPLSPGGLVARKEKPEKITHQPVGLPDPAPANRDCSTQSSLQDLSLSLQILRLARTALLFLCLGTVSIIAFWFGGFFFLPGTHIWHFCHLTINIHLLVLYECKRSLDMRMLVLCVCVRACLAFASLPLQFAFS